MCYRGKILEAFSAALESLGRGQERKPKRKGRAKGLTGKGCVTASEIRWAVSEIMKRMDATMMGERERDCNPMVGVVAAQKVAGSEWHLKSLTSLTP